MNAYLEGWRPVVGFPDYEVSNYGRVKSLKRGGSRILKLAVHRQGYLYVYLWRDNQEHYRYVHRLVGMSFLDNPYNYPIVRHLNDVPSDNFMTNLEWGTQHDNMRDAITNDSFKSQEIPIRIVEDGREFRSQNECARAIQGETKNIQACLKGRCKTHKGYHFEYVED